MAQMAPGREPGTPELHDDFERFVRERVAEAHQLARRILGDASRVAAVLPPAFCDAWGEADPEAALSRCVARRSLRELAARCADAEACWETLQPRFTAGRHLEPVAPWSESQLERIRSDGRVRSLVEGLPDPHRSVLILRDAAGWPVEEIGALLQLDVGATLATLHHARLALRARVDTAVRTTPRVPLRQDSASASSR